MLANMSSQQAEINLQRLWRLALNLPSQQAEGCLCRLWGLANNYVLTGNVSRYVKSVNKSKPKFSFVTCSR